MNKQWIQWTDRLSDVEYFQQRMQIGQIRSENPNHTQYSSGGVKQKIASWLSHLHASNIDDWIILMIDADPPSSGPRVWIKSDVLHKVKQDFNIPATGLHLLRITDRRAVDEKVFQEEWTILMRSLRRAILDVCQLTIQDYDAHLRLLEEAQESPGWDFFEYIARKEELVNLYLILNGYLDALHEYFETVSLLSKCIRRSAAEDRSENIPQWIKQLVSSTVNFDSNNSILSYFPTMDLSVSSYQSQMIRQRNANLFVIRSYFLSREVSLLISLNRCQEIPARALFHISAAIEESRLLKLHSLRELECCWAFLCALNCMAGMFQANKISEKSTGLPQSIVAVLSAAFGLDSKHSEQLRQSVLYQNPSCSSFKLSFLSNNVFLHASDTLNPLARPLANLADGLYSTLTTSHTLLSRVPLQNSPSKAIACAQLVDLWLLAYLQLSSVGRLLSLWHPPFLNDIPEPNSRVLQTIRSSVDHCSASDTTNQAAFNASAHKHLLTLLTSSTIYAEIHVAMAQTLIGFLQLLSQPRKSVYVCLMLADFLSSTKVSPETFDLYAAVLSTYLREGWSALATKVCVQLAVGLRSFLDRARAPFLWVSASSLDKSLLLRYFDCCVALSCASQSDLLLTAKSVKLDCSRCSSQNVCDLPESSRLNLSSADYWWSEAKSTHRLFPIDLAFDTTSTLSSPFVVDCVQLDGACDHGFQLITLHLVITAPVSFTARVSLTGADPGPDDWHSVMNYGLRDRRDQSTLPPSPNMLPVDLRQSILNNPDVRRLSTQSAHLSRPGQNISSVTSLEPSATPRPTLVVTDEEGRNQSFLSIAASFASRSTWRSQDHLASPDSTCYSTGMNHSRTQPMVHLSADRSVSVSTPSFPPTPTSGGYDRAGVRRACSLSGPCSNEHRNSSFVSVGRAARKPSLVYLNSDINTCFSKARMGPLDKNSNIVFRMADKSNMIILKPGLNKIRLSATRAGLLLPKVVYLELLNRVTDTSQTPSTADTMLSTPMKFTYRLQPDHFAPSWRCRSLLDSLLPSAFPSKSSDGVCSPVNVILGLRQIVPLELQVGRLGLSVEAHSTVQLYRVVSDFDTFDLLSPGRPGGRYLKLVNDYAVTSAHSVDPAEPCDTLVADEKQHRSSITLELQDGPVSLIDYTSSDRENVDPVTLKTPMIPPGSRIKLTRPLWLNAIADTNEFAVSIPSGFLCRLPVRIIRPLALSLNVQTLQRMDTVLFAIRVACMDIPDNSSEVNEGIAEPLTFKLSNLELIISAPSGSTRSYLTNPHFSRSGSISSFQDVSNLQTSAFKMKEMNGNLENDGHMNTPEIIVGAPVNPQYIEAYVNRLCPVTLLWRFRFTEFHPFVSGAIERFNEAPVAIFRCIFTRMDDPVHESQLTFTRRISPTRQRPVDRSSSMGNVLARNRKERVNS